MSSTEHFMIAVAAFVVGLPLFVVGINKLNEWTTPRKPNPYDVDER